MAATTSADPSGREHGLAWQRTTWTASPSVPLLQEDPGLARSLTASDRMRLLPHLRVAVDVVDAGPWAPADRLDEGRAFGYLVLDGVLLRDMTVTGKCCAELLGPGDLLRPWLHGDGDDGFVPAQAKWTVLQSGTRIAVIDRRATALIGRFPPLMCELLDRTATRVRSLQFQLAVSQVAGIDRRVRLLLWHLADRFGRVTPRGVVLTLDLTHEMIGRMIGARRPSVTTALCRLTDRGILLRRPGEWLLLADADELLGESRQLAGGASQVCP